VNPADALAVEAAVEFELSEAIDLNADSATPSHVVGNCSHEIHVADKVGHVTANWLFVDFERLRNLQDSPV
jgi:hypothetical protein